MWFSKYYPLWVICKKKKHNGVILLRSEKKMNEPKLTKSGREGRRRRKRKRKRKSRSGRYTDRELTCTERIVKKEVRSSSRGSSSRAMKGKKNSVSAMNIYIYISTCMVWAGCPYVFPNIHSFLVIVGLGPADSDIPTDSIRATLGRFGHILTDSIRTTGSPYRHVNSTPSQPCTHIINNTIAYKPYVGILLKCDRLFSGSLACKTLKQQVWKIKRILRKGIALDFDLSWLGYNPQSVPEWNSEFIHWC